MSVELITGLAFVFVVIAAHVVHTILVRLRRLPSTESRLNWESRYHVSVTTEAVSCTDVKGTPKRLQWSELGAVKILTNDGGPWDCDTFWALYDHSGSLALLVPNGATGEQQFVDALQRLPRFDNEQFIRAMHCLDNAEFECWTHSVDDPLSTH